MKKMYWRPQGMSVRVLILLGGLSAGAMAVVELYRVRERQPLHREKRSAALLAQRAFKVLKRERLRLGIPIDAESDPAQTGIIGELITTTTTNTGHLPAKQTSVNPNFAAVIVHMLGQVDVKRGDTIAMGLSGSFPALNVCAIAAAQTLRLKALIISSTGASQWGANHPLFTWPDMERHLAQEGVFSIRSLMVTPGGIDDRGFGLSEGGLKQIAEAMTRSGIQQLQPENYSDSLEKRMALYSESAGERDIRAYINVGGGTISVGTSIGKRMFRPGVNRQPPRGSASIDSVMTRFVSEGVPVVHISKIEKLAERYGLPLQPSAVPPVGQSSVFVREAYNVWLAAGALAVIIIALVAFLRLDFGYRLFSSAPKDDQGSRPEPMV